MTDFFSIVILCLALQINNDDNNNNNNNNDNNNKEKCNLQVSKKYYIFTFLWMAIKYSWHNWFQHIFWIADISKKLTTPRHS